MSGRAAWDKDVASKRAIFYQMHVRHAEAKAEPRLGREGLMARTLYIWLANRHSTSSSSTTWPLPWPAMPILRAVAKCSRGILDFRILLLSVCPSLRSS
jgi:hypothetical protein